MRNGASVAVALVVRGSPDVVGKRLAVVRRTPYSEADSSRRSVDADASLSGTLGDPALDRLGEAALREALADAGPGSARVPRTVALSAPAGKTEIYLEVHHPADELVIVGAGHVAMPLARMGTLLGFRVSVLDDRPGFATRERFPDAARVLPVDFDRPFHDLPLHARSHVILVTRGHRYDYACLMEALKVPDRPAYLGMIGSRRRVRATYLQLVADGIDAGRLRHVNAPIGLDIGAETPEEIAVAVAAELVLARRGGSGRPLSSVERIPERFFGAAAGNDGGRR